MIKKILLLTLFGTLWVKCSSKKNQNSFLSTTSSWVTLLDLERQTSGRLMEVIGAPLSLHTLSDPTQWQRWHLNLFMETRSCLAAEKVNFLTFSEHNMLDSLPTQFHTILSTDKNIKIEIQLITALHRLLVTGSRWQSIWGPMRTRFLIRKMVCQWASLSQDSTIGDRMYT